MTLTPALSHPMGEGERKTRLLQLKSADLRDATITTLSHRMGEGQGEGSSFEFEA